MTNFGPVNYSQPPPEPYRCSQCGASGVRLWRQFQMRKRRDDEDHVNLFCAHCAELYQASLNKRGWVSDFKKGVSDQIGWLIPAIPTEEGISFWSYLTYPNTAVAWWERMPTEPTEPTVPSVA